MVKYRSKQIYLLAASSRLRLLPVGITNVLIRARITRKTTTGMRKNQLMVAIRTIEPPAWKIV